MTNADYFLDNHRGFWRQANEHSKFPYPPCSGSDILLNGCTQEIQPGERFLVTGVLDWNKQGIVDLFLCEKCAELEA